MYSHYSQVRSRGLLVFLRVPAILLWIPKGRPSSPFLGLRLGGVFGRGWEAMTWKVLVRLADDLDGCRTDGERIARFHAEWLGE